MTKEATGTGRFCEPNHIRHLAFLLSWGHPGGLMVLKTSPAEFPMAEAKRITHDLFTPNPWIYWTDFLFFRYLGLVFFCSGRNGFDFFPDSNRCFFYRRFCPLPIGHLRARVDSFKERNLSGFPCGLEFAVRFPPDGSFHALHGGPYRPPQAKNFMAPKRTTNILISPWKGPIGF